MPKHDFLIVMILLFIALSLIFQATTYRDLQKVADIQAETIDAFRQVAEVQDLMIEALQQMGEITGALPERARAQGYVGVKESK